MQDPLNGEARALLDSPLLAEILAGLERESIEAAITTADHNERDGHIRQIHALRTLRERLKRLADGRAKPTPRPVV